MAAIMPRRAAGIGLAWIGLVLLVAGLALWLVAYLVADVSGYWAGAAFFAGFLILSGSSVLLRGTRDRTGHLDPVDTEQAPPP